MFLRVPALGRALRRFGRARRGATAVEMALVILPFFLLITGLAEVSMIGFAQSSLDFAVADSARRIRTGENQLANRSYTQIQTDLCNSMNNFLVLNCSGNLYLDVQRFASFVDAANGQTNPVQNNQFQTGSFGYNPGAPSDVVVVRAYYRWQVMTPLFQPIFQNISGGQRILVSTMMFRDEPYMASSVAIGP
jgi:Flp pilus assembly protein TadG